MLNVPVGSAAWRAAAGDVADWGPEQENAALAVDFQYAALQLQWDQLTADPTDEQVAAARRERAAARRAGRDTITAPPVRPVAVRPPGPYRDAADARWAAYCAELAGAHTDTDDEPDGWQWLSGSDVAADGGVIDPRG